MTSNSARAVAPARTDSPDRPDHIRVVGDLCPQVTLRVLGLFAQQSIIPRSVAMRRRRRTLTIDLAFDRLDAQATAILLSKIGAIVTVRSARRVRSLSSSG